MTARDSDRNPGPLRVAGRGLADRDGKPFVWLADTAWNLVSLKREEIDQYLDKRAAQGFTVIQFAPVFLEPDKFADAYGHVPFEGDVGHLRRTPGTDPANQEQYDFWDHVDTIVRAIHRRGMTAAMFPIWSDNHAGRTITAANARGFGEFLGKRYGGSGVVYALGGDDKEPHTDIWAPMADGLRAGAAAALDTRAAEGVRTTQDKPLVSYHPGGQLLPTYGYQGDFLMVQTSHCVREGYQALVADAYAAAGGKPVIDDEPLYETHPICWKPDQFGYSTAAQVRRQQYWGLFSGGFGIVYGQHAVWQFYAPGRSEGYAAPRSSWQEGLGAPGAEEIRNVGALLRSRPMEHRIPDDGLIADGVGQDQTRRAAMRDADGRWLMVYLPQSAPVRLDLGRVPGDRVRVGWFDPHTGHVEDSGERPKAEAATLTPPHRDAVDEESPDWVLIVDRVG